MANKVSSDRPSALPGGAAVWFVSVFVMPLAFIQWGSAIAAGSPLRWVAPCALAIVVVVTSPGQFLHRARASASAGALFGAIAALLVYVIVAVYVSASGAGLGWRLLETSCFWLAATLLAWRRLRTELSFDAAAAGAAFLLLGAAMILPGLEILHSSKPVLVGVAFILFGASALVLTVGALSGGLEPIASAVVSAVAAMLLGVAALLLVVWFAGGGSIGDVAGLLGVGSGLVVVAFVLLVVSFLLAPTVSWWQRRHPGRSRDEE